MRDGTLTKIAAFPDFFVVSTGTLTTAKEKDGQRYCKN